MSGFPDRTYAPVVAIDALALVGRVVAFGGQTTIDNRQALRGVVISNLVSMVFGVPR